MNHSEVPPEKSIPRQARSCMIPLWEEQTVKMTRRVYTAEFRREALQLLETSGKSGAQIERELGIGAGCLSRWKRKLAADGERGHTQRRCPQ